jgi:hypothetical protein
VHAAEDEEIEMEEEFGERRVQKLQNPPKPSAEEVDDHNKTHLPRRSWCRLCVRGRGEELPIDEEQRSQKATKCISIIVFLGRKMKLGKRCQS